MASKKYAYYNKGNKIAIVEQAATTSSGKMSVAHCTVSGYNNKTDCEAAGGQWIPGSSGNLDSYGEYTSPVESISKGLEIEYAYAPTYRVNGQKILGIDRFLFPFWCNVDGLLGFIRPPSGGNIALEDLTAAPYSSISAASSQDDDYILVEGSGIWDGIHKIKASGSNGILLTYTKVVGQSNYRTNLALDFSAATDIIYDGTTSPPDDWLGQNYSAGDYVYVGGSASEENNGIWKVDAANENVLLPSNNIKVTEKTYVSYDADTNVTTTTATNLIDETDQTDIILAQAFPINKCFISADVEVMQDESFELDITRAQAKSIVYYLKAMQAEERQDIESREYFMSLFRKDVGRNAAARKHGVYMASGFWSMK